MSSLFLYFSIFIANIGTNTSAKFHAFHTSITQLEYNSKEKVHEVSIRIFTDDLEKTLALVTKNSKIKITNGDDNDEIVEDYLQKHFVISNSQKQRYKMTYVGKENEDIATWVYFELPAEATKAGNQIKQTTLKDIFDDQINIVNILNQGQKKSYVFDGKTNEKLI